MLHFVYVYQCLLLTSPLEWQWSIRVDSYPVDILCEASRAYSISPIRPTCLYSRLDSSRAIYQIAPPRLSGVQTDGSYDPWEGDHGWAVLFICSHVRHAWRLCELICGSITPDGPSTNQQQCSSHHCYDQSVFSSLWRCGISERTPIFGGFLLLKRRTSRSISVGVFGFNLGKFITLFNTMILQASFSESEKICTRSALSTKRIIRNLMS